MTQSNLAVQSEAISLYLDSLLKDVPDDEMEPAEPAKASTKPVPEVAAEPEVVTEPEPQPEPLAASEPPIQAEAKPEPDIRDISEPDISELAKPELKLAGQPDAIIPDWANGPFQAMLFKVGELSLALPLSELTGVVEWRDMTSDAGATGIRLGTHQYNGKPVPIVDTARLILPASMVDDLVGANHEERISRIVIIQDGKWGLACDSVHELITLQPENIRWHTVRTRRQWLAGTSVDLMCALVDTEGLVTLLDAAIKE